MKRALTLLFLSSVMCAPALRGAEKIWAVQTPGASYSDGGQFTATIVVDGAPVQTFQTFCIESQNTFNPGSGNLYDFTLTQHTHAEPSHSAGVDLTQGAAWLFSQFAAGKLAGYSSTPSLAGELQAALWYFQGQPMPNTDYKQFNDGQPSQSGASGNGFTDLAISSLSAMGVNNAFAPSDGAYDVSIIDCTDGQDWLFVPDGGMTAMLLGMGLVGLGWVRRQVKA